MKEKQNQTESGILNAMEAAAYLSISKGYLYRLVMQRKIPYYKPNRKKLYFRQNELEAYLTKNRYPSNSELDFIAMNR